MIAPAGFWAVIAFLFGTSIGSFLNVVIWRLSQGILNPDTTVTLTRPEWSFCPNCKTRLRAPDLVPLLSFLALGRRCRYCKTPISWRYFSIEFLTGLLFVVLTLRFLQSGVDCITLILFTAVLIPIFFIDLATFSIPDTLNLLAFFIALGRDIWGIVQHEPGHALLWGWLPRSILGAVVGVLIFGIVRVFGWIGFKKEAMGLGDVLLARAMGAMLVSVTLPGFHPLRLFPAWVMLACFSGLIIGGAMLTWRHLHAPRSDALSDTETVEESAEEETTLKNELAAIGYCLILGDLIDTLGDLLATLRGKRAEPELPEPEDSWQPEPTAIPFGPYLVLGFLLTVFFGEGLTAWYLAFALPKAQESAGLLLHMR
jgi:leader peptidase (prepilin peptidase)/N-methyltransferase